MHEYHTFSCIGDMAIGAFGAYFSSKDSYRLKIEDWKKEIIIPIYLTFLAIFFVRNQLFYSNHYCRIFERLFVAIVILLIILEQNFSRHSFFKLSSLKFISKLGVLTYGLYCLHFIGILVTITITKKLKLNTNLWEVIILETLISLILTVLIGWISYNYFEKFFLKIKDSFSVITKK